MPAPTRTTTVRPHQRSGYAGLADPGRVSAALNPLFRHASSGERRPGNRSGVSANIQRPPEPATSDQSACAYCDAAISAKTSMTSSAWDTYGRCGVSISTYR